MASCGDPDVILALCPEVAGSSAPQIQELMSRRQTLLVRAAPAYMLPALPLLQLLVHGKSACVRT